METSAISTGKHEGWQSSKPPQTSALHLAVWNGDEKLLEELLQQKRFDVEAKDFAGNTALHLAAKCGHRNKRALAALLLGVGANSKSRDQDYFHVLQTTICSRDEGAASDLLLEGNRQAYQKTKAKLLELKEKLQNIPDFYAEIQFAAKCWIPFVSKLFPSDTIKIWKRQTDIRADFTLTGFEKLQWKRGNNSVLLLGEQGRLLLLNHEEHQYGEMTAEHEDLSPQEVEDTLHLLSTTKLVAVELYSQDTVFRKRSSWMSSSDTVEDVGSFENAKLYDMANMKLRIAMRDPVNPRRVRQVYDPNAKSMFKEITEMLSDFDQFGGEEITIASKMKHVIPVELGPSDEVCWEVKIASYSISIFAAFLPQEEPSTSYDDISLDDQDIPSKSQIIVCPETRWDATAGVFKGSYLAKQRGFLHIVLDNTFSFFRSKVVQCKIYPKVDMSDGSSADSLPRATSTSIAAKYQDVSLEVYFGKTSEELKEACNYPGPLNPSMRLFEPPATKRITKAFNGTVHMCEEFPLSVDDFLPIAYVLRARHFENIRQFFQLRLPKGFPVKFEIPVVPTVYASVTFTQATLETPEPTLFEVPTGYAKTSDKHGEEAHDELR